MGRFISSNTSSTKSLGVFGLGAVIGRLKLHFACRSSIEMANTMAPTVGSLSLISR
jgi:hypothetical protein